MRQKYIIPGYFPYGGSLLEAYTPDDDLTNIGKGLYGLGTAVNQLSSIMPEDSPDNQPTWLDKVRKTFNKNYDYTAYKPQPIKRDIVTIRKNKGGLSCGGKLYDGGGMFSTIEDSDSAGAKFMKGAGSVLGMAGAGLQGYGNNSQLNTGALNAAQQASAQKAGTQVTSNSFDSLMKDWSMNNNLRTDYTGRNFRTSDGQRLGSTLGSVSSGAMAGSVFGPWGAAAGALVGLGSSVAGMITGNSKARKEAEKANRVNTVLNAVQQNKLMDRANVLRQQQARSIARSFVAEGGPLNLAQGGPILMAAPQADTPIGYQILNQSLYNNENNEESKVNPLGKPFALGGQVKTQTESPQNINDLQEGQVLDGISQKEINRLKALGYEFDIIG